MLTIKSHQYVKEQETKNKEKKRLTKQVRERNKKKNRLRYDKQI